MCGIWTKRSLLSRQYLRVQRSLRIKACSEHCEVDLWVQVRACVRGVDCGLFFNKRSSLSLFFFLNIYISVYFGLIGPQASCSSCCRIPRVSWRSTFYFITPSKGMRSLISVGLTLRLLGGSLSDQIFRPQQTPIIRIIASHGNKETSGGNSPKTPQSVVSRQIVC